MIATKIMIDGTTHILFTPENIVLLCFVMVCVGIMAGLLLTAGNALNGNHHDA